ncbi:hypothetical protein ABK040_004009 [Willaertia magna]
MSSLIPTTATENVNFYNLFENKLSTDEKKVIISFLDISSLCNVSCVSKNFSLSQLSNDDLFWKDYFKIFITEYYKPTNRDIYQNIYYNRIRDIEKRIETTLQSTTKDYKNSIIKFVKEIIENIQKIQNERLLKIEFDQNSVLLDKETLLQKASLILKGQKNHKKLCDCKIVTVGDGAVGKTCMLMTLSVNFSDIKNVGYIPSVLENYNLNVTFNNLKEGYNINIWDTAGQSEYDRLRTLSYYSTDILLLCFSVVDEWSFEHIVETWITEIQHYCPEKPFILCGTKIDLRENKKLSFHLGMCNFAPFCKEEGEALAKKVGAIAYVETSSFEHVGFDNLAEYILLLSKVGKKSLLEENVQTKKKCLMQ